MAVFTCPECAHTQAVDDKYIGKTATCPKCKTQGAVNEDASLIREVPSTAFVEAESRRVIHATAGPLGIRCDSWMDSQRHINKASSLQVDWWTVVDDTLPIQFRGPCGLLVHNESKDYPLALVYKATMPLECTAEDVTACEVRYLTFNVWGQHVSTLVVGLVQDIPAGKRITMTRSWTLDSADEAAEYCASLGFVSRARLASGTVRSADLTFVLREAQRICEKVTEADLERNAPRKT